MSDDAYSLVMALTCVGYALVLWFRFQQGRSLRRLKRLLDESAKSAAAPPPEDPPGEAR